MYYDFTRLPFSDAWLGFSGSIPDIYWNVWSDEQRYHWLCKQLGKLVEYSNELNACIIANSDAIEELAEQLVNIQSPEYWDKAFKQIVTEWIAANLDYIYRYTIKQIYFALDNAGHLVAFIPESWEDISFFTPLNYSNQETYGHLQILLNDIVHIAEEEL